ncbi:MAG: peptidase [Methylocystaceae bacterium]|nr:MAG: peptidase [Methylocystaceae bacterium]
MAHFLPQVIDRPMTDADRAALQAAVDVLETTSFAQRLAVLAGRQIGFAGRMVPGALQEAAAAAARKGLNAALRVAISSLANAPARDSVRLHRRLAAASGAIGGAIGLASLPVELPVSTTIMLRSIADIARLEGENLAEPETALACLQVFALGGHAEEGNILEGGYLAIRGVLAKSVTDAARYMTHRTIAEESAPVLVKLIGLIASRFGVVVSQKAAAQAVPLFGAMSGAAINLAFTEHFQSLARGHFTVRRLERAYGRDVVQAEYVQILEMAGFEARRTA